MSEQVSMTSATSGGVAETYFVHAQEPIAAPGATMGLFDVAVYGADEFELIPRTALARSLLGMWLGMDMRPALRLHGGRAVSDCAWGRDVKNMRFTMASHPLLARDNDPFFTGRRITPEDYEACKKLLDERYAARAQAVKPQPKRVTKRRKR